jgi:hypothetical protein
VSAIRTLARLSHTIGIAGGFLGFAAQWVMFRPGNFSESQGAVFILFLGEHGVYTSSAIGIAWYVGIALFVIGLGGTAICWILEQRHQRKDSEAP